MTDERTRLLAEKARIEAEHPDKCFTDGVRQLAEIIREQRTPIGFRLRRFLIIAQRTSTGFMPPPAASAELAKLDAEPDWGPAAKAFWQGPIPAMTICTQRPRPRSFAAHRRRPADPA